jgi:ABC-type polysaccharide/polyol phosphate export permease
VDIFMAPGSADLLKSLRHWRLVVYMAWSDIRARYKRSILGPLWITLGTAIGVVGLGFVWSELFKMERATFVPLLTIGLILWQLLSGCITEAASVFTRQSSIIRNLNLPLGIHPAQLVLRHLINLAHSIPLFFAVALILGTPLTMQTLMAIPNLLLVIANLYWIVLLIGILGSRYRDLEYLINMIMPLLMFLSPVMYRPSALPFQEAYLWLNPLADMIEIVRQPLLGEPVPPFVYYANGGLLLVGGLVTMVLFNAKRNRLAFWV